jgi:hypothetical protein
MSDTDKRRCMDNEVVRGHMWAIAFHATELFKQVLPEEDKHVTMALASATLSKFLTELDPDFNWNVRPGKIDEE